MDNNYIELIGKSLTDFEYSYSAYGEDFYSLRIEVIRTSGIADELMLICSNRAINTNIDIKNKYLSVLGSIRTRNEDGHLRINVFVEKLSGLDLDEETDYIGENNVCVEGYICKHSDDVRTTPLGRTIYDLSLAVNRCCGRTDYLPIIAWGKNAKYLSTLPIGSNIRVTGRLQSRNYIKNDTMMTAYEISAQTVGIVTNE